jgi:small subunit ribosomal protein S15
MLTKDKKTRIINKYRTHESDTGSPQIQIAILSAEIKDLTNHLKNHKHDHSSRRGLLKKVSERRKLLKYLQKEDPKSFKNLVQSLNLKIAKKLQAEEEEKINKEKKLEEIANPLVDEKEDLK